MAGLIELLSGLTSNLGDLYLSIPNNQYPVEFNGNLSSPPEGLLIAIGGLGAITLAGLILTEIYDNHRKR